MEKVREQSFNAVSRTRTTVQAVPTKTLHPLEPWTRTDRHAQTGMHAHPTNPQRQRENKQVTNWNRYHWRGARTHTQQHSAGEALTFVLAGAQLHE